MIYNIARYYLPSSSDVSAPSSAPALEAEPDFVL
jgi:hypothetical protein